MSVPLHESPIVRPGITEVEQHGIDTIPPEHRHSTPFDLFRIQFGGANTFATVILGTNVVMTRNGGSAQLMKLVIAMTPASVNSLATSPMRRMFSARSSAEKPRFLFNPIRMLSPSSR